MCQEYQGRHNALLEERKAAELEERDLRGKMASMEVYFDQNKKRVRRFCAPF